MSLIIIIISFNIPSGSYILHAVIALMHDFVNRTKFTTNSRLREIFSNLWHLRVVFTRILFIFAALGIFHDKIGNLHFERGAWW